MHAPLSSVLRSSSDLITNPDGAPGLGALRSRVQASVLFAEPLPETPEALAGWLEALGLAELGFRVAWNEQGLQLTRGPHTVQALPCRGPMPREGLDLRQLPDLPREAGFLSLASNAPLAGADPWAEDGPMRALSTVVARLAHEGTAVVLHQAGSLVKDSRTFARLLQGLPHPDYRPFLAWVDFTRRPGSRHLRLRGMESFGLPDLLLAPEEWDTWETTRAREALFFAAHRMVRENRPLSEDDVLEVPLDVQPGSWPMRAAGDTLSYRVRVGEPSGLVLERISDAAEPFNRWARASAPGRPSPSSVGLNTYQALLRHALEGALPGDTLAEMAPPSSQGLPAHLVLIRTRMGTDGFTLVTNGFGRVAQPSGTHVELAAWMDSHSPERALALSALGALMQSAEASQQAWEQGDIAVTSEPLLGLRHFVLARGPVVPMPPGSPVNLLWVIPLHADEFARVRRAGPLPWAQQLLKDPSRRAELRQRWSLGVH